MLDFNVFWPIAANKRRVHAYKRKEEDRTDVKEQAVPETYLVPDSDSDKISETKVNERRDDNEFIGSSDNDSEEISSEKSISSESDDYSSVKSHAGSQSSQASSYFTCTYTKYSSFRCALLRFNKGND